MAPNLNKIKTITFSLDTDQSGVGTPVEYQCQIRSWTLTPPQEDGERVFTQCPEGDSVEDPEDVWSLELTFLSDWSDGGISDVLQLGRGQLADFVLDHHPDVPTQHVQWSGVVKLKAPPIGGEARAREEQSVTLACVGVPAYSRPAGG